MSRWSSAFEREVLRINERFNHELVEAFAICPYAKGARHAGSSIRLVCPLEQPNIGALIEVIEGLERREGVEVEVAQVILPLLALDAPSFQEFASDVGRANAARTKDRPVFVQAAFHPELPYSTETPHRLVPFFRRSPDPMIQFVRLSTLDALHEGRPRGTQFFDGTLADLQALLAPRKESVTDKITRENHAAAMAGALEKYEAIQASIRDDRARSYEPFLRADSAVSSLGDQDVEAHRSARARDAARGDRRAREPPRL